MTSRAPISRDLVRKIPRAIASLTAAGLLVFTVACQQSEPEPSEPSETPSPTSKKEPYTTPEPTVTEKPEPRHYADDNSAIGAITFVQQYRELYEYAIATDDWKPLKNKTSNDCQPCTRLWNPKGHLETRGGKPPAITYSDQKYVELSIKDDDPSVTVNLRQRPGIWVPTNGNEPRKVGPEDWGVHFYLERHNGSWQVHDIEISEAAKEHELDYIW